MNKEAIALELLKVELAAWQQPMSRRERKHRALDFYKRHGNVTISKALVLDSIETAEILINAIERINK